MKINRSNLLSWAKFLIGWPLALLSIAFVIKFVADQSQGISLSLSDINYFYLILGIGLFFLYYFLRGFLWKILIESGGKKIDIVENTYRFSFSELKRFTPGNVWSFLSRASLFTELGFEKRIIGVSMIADIQLVVIGCGLVSVFAIPFILNSSNELHSRLSALIPFSVILIAVYFIVIGVIYKKRYDKSAGVFQSLLLPGFKTNIKLKTIIFSFITYFIYGLGNFFVSISIVNTSFSHAIMASAFFTFALLVGYLTFITPMGLGVREIIVTLGLSEVMSPADAGAVSIFTRIILIISELSFLCLIFLWRGRQKKQ
jgi:uncharacterized membrane protein YbhN (UPF0104 family)